MRKLLIILAFVSCSVYGQDILLKTNGAAIKFNSNALTIIDTSTAVTIVGDGITIGDGIIVGDPLITDAIIEMPEQYMRKEETENELMS